MGRQIEEIISSLGPLSGGTGLSINANLTELEALVTTLQADVADGVRIPNATTGGTGPTDFTSTSYGTIATASTGRLGCTIFNSGPGNLHVMLGTATASTSAFSVRLSSGDYYEVPFNYTGLIGGIFATAGTAEVTQLS
jgi:hypothetical protein